MADKEQSIFRKKTLERISSPEQLNDYLRVTNPGVWVVLASVVLLLAGLFAWASIGTLETTRKAGVVVKEDLGQVAIGNEEMKEGMKLRIFDKEYTISSVKTDMYGREYGEAKVNLPDGTYEGTVVVEEIKPIDFLLKSN